MVMVTRRTTTNKSASMHLLAMGIFFWPASVARGRSAASSSMHLVSAVSFWVRVVVVGVFFFLVGLVPT
jgi:hypothetical protein